MKIVIGEYELFPQMVKFEEEIPQIKQFFPPHTLRFPK